MLFFIHLIFRLFEMQMPWKCRGRFIFIILFYDHDSYNFIFIIMNIIINIAITFIIVIFCVFRYSVLFAIKQAFLRYYYDKFAAMQVKH